jgi:hypothetical protein
LSCGRYGYALPDVTLALLQYRPLFEELTMAKKKQRAVRAWSREDVKNLRALAKARLSGSQVAQKLRRTRGAVAQKAMKLGVRFRSIRGKRR